MMNECWTLTSCGLSPPLLRPVSNCHWQPTLSGFSIGQSSLKPLETARKICPLPLQIDGFWRKFQLQLEPCPFHPATTRYYCFRPGYSSIQCNLAGRKYSSKLGRHESQDVPMSRGFAGEVDSWDAEIL